MQRVLTTSFMLTVTFYKNEIVEVLLVEINSNKLDIIFFINIEKHRISQIFTADYVFVIMDDIRSIY